MVLFRLAFVAALSASLTGCIGVSITTEERSFSSTVGDVRTRTDLNARLLDHSAAMFANVSTSVIEGRVQKVWRETRDGIAESLQEAGERLFTFAQVPVEQWKSARTKYAIERLHEEFKRQIKTQTVLPSAKTAAMLFWSLLAGGQIVPRKVDGWKSLAAPIGLAA